MKQIYLLRLVMFLFTFVPQLTRAQCTTCSPGFTIDSVVQEVTLSGILPFNSIVPFNQFNPATGNLNCVRTSAVVTTTIEMDLVNRDDTKRVTYNMVYTRVTTLNGPGVSPTSSTTRLYGPFDLGQATVDPDSAVHIGPDVVFNARVLTQTTSNVVPYLGTGTVNFTYFNNGSWLMTTGNDNYGLDVAAVSEVTIRVVYFFCPNTVLSSGMRNFNVRRANRRAEISWTVDDDNEGNSYKPEYSFNGRDFNAFDDLRGQGRGNRLYRVSHDIPEQADTRIYYRVKQQKPGGETFYTSIQRLNLDKDVASSLTPALYPNPARDQVNLGFSSPQTGTLTMDLVSLTGQVLQSRTLRATGLTNVQFPLRAGLPAGTYWLRIANRELKQAELVRLMIIR